jgi:alkylation response protein AidB-like acyl-CoA dehydrogenase
VRAALAVVPDERSHVALAWQVVTWCCAAGEPGVVEHVRALADELPKVRAQRDVPPHLHAELTAHGWLSPSDWRELGARTQRSVVERTTSLLADTAKRPITN